MTEECLVLSSGYYRLFSRRLASADRYMKGTALSIALRVLLDAFFESLYPPTPVYYRFPPNIHFPTSVSVGNAVAFIMAVTDVGREEDTRALACFPLLSARERLTAIIARVIFFVYIFFLKSGFLVRGIGCLSR